MKPMEFKVYLTEPKLCVVDNLKEYLKKTKPIRKHPELFLSYYNPHAPVSKDTIARWSKEITHTAGIDIDKYSPHSSISAAASYAKSRGITMKDIYNSAGWSNEKAFAFYYNKELETDNIGNTLLQL